MGKADIFSTVKTASKNKKALYELLSGDEFTAFSFTCMQYIIIYSGDETSHEKHREAVISQLQQGGVEILSDECCYSLSDIKFL